VIRHRIAATVVIGMAMLAGCAAAQPTGSPGDMTASLAASGSAAPDALGRGDVPLEAGTYRVDLAGLAPGSDPYPTFEVTVPDGWVSSDGWAIARAVDGQDAPSVAVTFWDVDQVYGHPCAWAETLTDPGPTVDDLVTALLGVAMRNPTMPVPVNLDGRQGIYLEWSVPTDIAFDENGDFPECDPSGDGHRDFRSWTGSGWASTRYHQGPGQVDRLWILDVDGERLVIDAFSMPSARETDVRELVDLVASIRFVDE
jgi:hypothetical protein